MTLKLNQKKHASGSLRIVIAGYIVGGPLGGLVWHHFQYVLGLMKLGHDVLFVEDSDDYPSCYNPDTYCLSTDCNYGIRFIQTIFSRFGIEDKWAYYHASTATWFGCSETSVKKFYATADLVINLSGVNPFREQLHNIPKRVFLDTDPVFTQIRHLTEPMAMKTAKKHNLFFSFGENFGKFDCSIPNDSFAWRPTRQPVVLDCWQTTDGNAGGAWTTVMQWDSYKVRLHDGKEYGMKSKSFSEFINLPASTDQNFQLAIGSETVPTATLETHGWTITDPLAVTKTADSFQQFIRQSKGEWSVAKHGYVSSHSGWFSERSTGYLASGRPVIVQDTGFSTFLPTGVGLLSFTNMEDAITALDSVNACYKKHCMTAREIAEEYFDSEKVLTRLIEDVYSKDQ